MLIHSTVSFIFQHQKETNIIIVEYQNEYFSHSMLLTGGYEKQETHTLKKKQQLSL